MSSVELAWGRGGNLKSIHLDKTLNAFREFFEIEGRRIPDDLKPLFTIMNLKNGALKKWRPPKDFFLALPWLGMTLKLN